MLIGRGYLVELFRQIKTYLPEQVLANKNLFAWAPSVCYLNIFHLRTGFFGQKKWAHMMLVSQSQFGCYNTLFPTILAPLSLCWRVGGDIVGVILGLCKKSKKFPSNFVSSESWMHFLCRFQKYKFFHKRMASSLPSF